jgi:predicted amidohydrolase/HEAT repeat protein
MQDRDYIVQCDAASTLGVCYSHIPVEYRKQAWDNLIGLTQDKENLVREYVANALGVCYSHIPVEYREQAWDDLHRLTQDKDYSARKGAAGALGVCYSHIPIEYKKQAWDDLHRFTKYKESHVRRDAAGALGVCYSHIPIEYRKQACDDLHRLAQDNDIDVQIAANHASGSISIYKASQAKSDESVRKELETALRFFEKASKVSTHFNPAKFCLPFYRSFYAITFRKEEAEAEVKKYLTEAKSAVEGSKSKEKLLEAVENLGNALSEVQKARDLDAMKTDLNAYRRYCDRACELLDTTQEKAPGASSLIRKGLPIIDERIQGILGEIQEKAKTLCKKTQGTPLEPLGNETNQKAKLLSGLDYLSTDIRLNDLIPPFKAFCDYIPLNKRGEICDKLKTIENMDLRDKTQIIKDVLYSILGNMDNPAIRTIPIASRKNQIIRIAAVQLDFKLSTDKFPPELIKKQKIRTKVLNAIRIAKNKGVQILCLPELCICEDWLPEIKNECGCMILIAGSFYDKENHNLCQVICDSNMDIPPQLKFHPSAFEDSKIAGTRMARGNKLVYVYETEFGSFSVLICRDFGNFIPHLRGKVDIIFVPSYNSANERFHKEADNHVTNNPSYIIISNTALYGGTSIFGQLNKGYFPVLVQKKYKKKDDSNYKLCEIEAEKEGMIIAEFDLDHKSPQLQTTINPDEEIIPVRNIQIIEL